MSASMVSSVSESSTGSPPVRRTLPRWLVPSLRHRSLRDGSPPRGCDGGGHPYSIRRREDSGRRTCSSSNSCIWRQTGRRKESNPGYAGAGTSWPGHLGWCMTRWRLAYVSNTYCKGHTSIWGSVWWACTVLHTGRTCASRATAPRWRWTA